MQNLTRNEFVTLLVSNPGKKFVFQEDWDNDTYDPSIHITSGNPKCPTFGAFYIGANEDDLLSEYDWDLISDYTDADEFHVFDENDIKDVINLLSSAIYSEKESEDKYEHKTT